MARQRSSSFLRRQKELERQERKRLKRERRKEKNPIKDGNDIVVQDEFPRRPEA